MQIGLASATAAEALLEIDDIIRREQYLDFLKGRMFRQTLLCHADERIQRRPRPSVIAELAVSTPAVRSDESGATVFEGPTGSTLTTDNPLVIAAIEQAAAAWPAAVWVRDLGPDDALCAALLRAYGANMVQLHVHPPALSARPGERPEVTGSRATKPRTASSSPTSATPSWRPRTTVAAGSSRCSTGPATATRWRSELGDADALERSLDGLAQLALIMSRDDV